MAQKCDVLARSMAQNCDVLARRQQPLQVEDLKITKILTDYGKFRVEELKKGKAIPPELIRRMKMLVNQDLWSLVVTSKDARFDVTQYMYIWKDTHVPCLALLMYTCCIHIHAFKNNEYD